MNTATKILRVGVCTWLSCFIVLTLISYEAGEVGYSGGEWYISFGYPSWLNLGGVDGMGNWRENLKNGVWSLQLRNLMIAMCVSLAPIVIVVTAYLVRMRRLRFSLLTIIAMVFISGVIVWANVRVGERFVHWGWPLNLRLVPYLHEVFISDISVAINILCFTALAVECLVRKATLKIEFGNEKG